MPLCNLSQRENGAIMLMTFSSLCITFILPMRSENTFQTAWNVFHPITQLLCYDAVQKLLHKTNSSASMQDSLCTVFFFFCQNLLKNVQRCFLVYFKDPVWTVLVISEIFLSVICSLVRKKLWCTMHQSGLSNILIQVKWRMLNVNVYCQTSPVSRLAWLSFWLRVLFSLLNFNLKVAKFVKTVLAT